MRERAAPPRARGEKVYGRERVLPRAAARPACVSHLNCVSRVRRCGLCDCECRGAARVTRSAALAVSLTLMHY